MFQNLINFLRSPLNEGDIRLLFYIWCLFIILTLVNILFGKISSKMIKHDKMKGDEFVSANSILLSLLSIFLSFTTMIFKLLTIGALIFKNIFQVYNNILAYSNPEQIALIFTSLILLICIIFKDNDLSQRILEIIPFVITYHIIKYYPNFTPSLLIEITWLIIIILRSEKDKITHLINCLFKNDDDLKITFKKEIDVYQDQDLSL